MPTSSPRRPGRHPNPARAVFAGFGMMLLTGTMLLWLPAASTREGRVAFSDALFTATSALCVTGLTTVDTATAWTPLGKAVILGLIQLGGLGVMTFATLVGVAVARRVSFRERLNTARERGSAGLADVAALVRAVLATTMAIEAIVAVLLLLRFWLHYGHSFPTALWYGVFHSVSAFNNAGFALFSTNLMPFVGDPFICLPIAAAIILGGLGFPVLFQLRRHLRTVRWWTMNTRLVLVGTPLLLLAGTVLITALEWSNPGTLGPLPWPQKLLAGFFQSVQTRTAGFNSVDVAAMDSATWFGMTLLMFVGAGPAGTAGGIKITTFLVLLAVIVTEVRGDSAVNVLGKRLARSTHRQAIAVALLAVAVVVAATTALMVLTEFSLDQLLFEAVSAFGTVGLSTGITPQLPVLGQLVLVVLMFIGRLGPITLATALAMKPRHRTYELPKESPIIG